LQAVKRIAADCKSGKISINNINDDLFKEYLSLAGICEPDFFIRTSGELRMSNFLLWDLAYAEFYFTDVFWPDFGEKEFQKALDVFAKRERRFGNIEAVTAKK
jgi:undecaprenyl diphosphate synthase